MGGNTIDYDRQIVGGTGSVYVAFDGNRRGRRQALGVLGGMKKNGTYNANGTVAQLWAGPTDANAFWFKSGNDVVLNPLFRGKKLKKGPRGSCRSGIRPRPRRSSSRCSSRRATTSRASSPRTTASAGAVVATLKAKGLKPIPLSGQDNTVQGVQNIISGFYTMTVYKYVPDEANAAAAAAIALYKGKKPPSNGTRPNGKKKQLAYVIPVLSITKANYTRPSRDGVLKRSEVCSGPYKKVPAGSRMK